MRYLTLKRLESDKIDLENQGKQLVEQKQEMEMCILQVAGALNYIIKRIKTVKGEKDNGE